VDSRDQLDSGDLVSLDRVLLLAEYFTHHLRISAVAAAVGVPGRDPASTRCDPEVRPLHGILRFQLAASGRNPGERSGWKVGWALWTIAMR
jgi:hypothetical protein